MSKRILDERPDISLAHYLEKIYEGRAHAEYMGGSLMFFIMDNLEKVITSISLKNCKYEEEKFWYSMIYVKNKTTKHSFWYDSIDCIVLYAEKYNQVEAIKVLLLSGVDK